MDPKIEMQPGVDHMGQIAPFRKIIAENLAGESVKTVTPDAEIAEAETANFLKDVVNIHEEIEPGQVESPDSSSALADLGESNVRTASSNKFLELEQEKKACLPAGRAA